MGSLDLVLDFLLFFFEELYFNVHSAVSSMTRLGRTFAPKVRFYALFIAATERTLKLLLMALLDFSRTANCW